MIQNRANISSTEPLRVGNRVLTNDMDISNSFNSFYSTKQRLKKSLKTRQKIIGREIRNIALSQSHGHEIFQRNFSISELREAVGHIRCAKSPGPDNFHPEFLKHLGCNALSVLLTLYNHSWKYGVPAIWKKAIVVPIPKKNKPLDDLNSYRPISLTSILSKVMERMITSRLDWYLETNNLLNSSQAGFRKCQSTNQQVVFLGQSIKDTLDQRHSALALFVDFEAAFDKPFTNIIEKNAAILFNRLIRLPNNSFWRDYDSDGGRNLKTQKGFIQCVRENIQYKVINDVPFELLSFANPLDYAILDIRLDLVLNVRKSDLSPTALHAIALETINTRFPPEEWLHIYTNGSLLDFAQGAGNGVFSHLFSFYLHAGPLTTHFDGEAEAIHIALQQLAVHLPPIERAVILSDSTSALQALSNYNENNCLRVQNCRELLGKIKGKIVFQWVPSHCGLWGNERADFLAKKGTGILQNFRRDLTLHSAKLEIKMIFRESFRLTASRVARDKPWSTLCKKSHGIPSSPRAAAVAKFRLLTGHDCLCAHLFRFNLVTSPICVLCDTGHDMTAAHLDECSALNDLNCIVKRRRRIPFDFQRTSLAELASDSATRSGLERAPRSAMHPHPGTTWSYKAGEIIHQLIEQPGHAG
ncbi:uncharacterized protein LOC103524116 [Trichonephila clavipes]|nr:uncharacterized protein LOC103524116 [Trichonephila clavipes]